MTASWNAFIFGEVGLFSIAFHRISISGVSIPRLRASRMKDSSSCRFLSQSISAAPGGKWNQSSRNFWVMALAIFPGLTVHWSSIISSSSL